MDQRTTQVWERHTQAGKERKPQAVTHTSQCCSPHCLRHPPDSRTELASSSLPLGPAGATAASSYPASTSAMPGATSRQLATSTTLSLLCCGVARSAASESCSTATRCCEGR